VIPAVVPESDVFNDFDALKKALDGRISEMEAKSDAARASFDCPNARPADLDDSTRP
jgi:hypothetical protein